MTCFNPLSHNLLAQLICDGCKGEATQRVWRACSTVCACASLRCRLPAKAARVQCSCSNICGTATSKRSPAENSFVPAGSTITPASLNLCPLPLVCCCTVTRMRQVACWVACREGDVEGQLCRALHAEPGCPLHIQNSCHYSLITNANPPTCLVLQALHTSLPARQPRRLPSPLLPPSSPFASRSSAPLTAAAPTANSAVINIDAFSPHSASMSVGSHLHPATHWTRAVPMAAS